MCEPDARRCALSADAGVAPDSQAVIVCNALGTEQTVERCAPTEYCDPALAACTPMRCAPGELACSAETITQCAPDGSSVNITDRDCATTDQACWSGACLPRVCNGEGSLVCADGKSFACRDNGTRLALADTCGLEKSTYCDPAKGTCSSFACEPAQPLCNAELATSYRNDGSGPRDTGIDCAASGKVCWDGECLPVVCQAAYQCSPNGELLRCDKHGTALVVEKTCGGGANEQTVCDAEAGTCRLQKCPPSQPACNGSVATTCDATGLDFDPLAPVVDCSATQTACVDGTCRPIICSPHLTYCAATAATGATESIAAAQLRRCDATGTDSTFVATCGDAEFCRAGETTCLPRVCSPGSLICSGTVLTHCADDGSGPSPASGDTDCATAAQACDLGACRPIVCAPNQRLCQDNDVYVCNAAGTNAAVYDNCDAREYCDSPAARPQDTACRPDLCIASRPACTGETLASCKPDGSRTENPSLDCSANNKVCDLRGTCLDEAVDTLAASATESFVPTNATIHFALVRVTTTRRLTQLAFPLTIPGAGAHTINWFVYRSTLPQGPYARILLAADVANENATTSRGRRETSCSKRARSTCSASPHRSRTKSESQMARPRNR